MTESCYFRQLLGSLAWGGHAACSMRASLFRDLTERPGSIHKLHSALCAHCCTGAASRFSQRCELNANYLFCEDTFHAFIPWLKSPSFNYNFVAHNHCTHAQTPFPVLSLCLSPIQQCAKPQPFSALTIPLPAAAPAEPGLRAEEQPEKNTTQPFNKTLSSSHLDLLCGSCSWY